MKKLTQFGTQFVTTTRSRTSSGKHDPWPSHAVAFWGLGIAFGGTSGIVYAGTSFTLKDGLTYQYIHKGIADDFNAGEQWLNDFNDRWNPPNQPQPSFGVGFNKELQKSVLFKGSAEETAEWLAQN